MKSEAPSAVPDIFQASVGSLPLASSDPWLGNDDQGWEVYDQGVIASRFCVR